MLASVEEQHSAAWKVFNKHFFVRVENQFLYTDNFLKFKGIISHTPQAAMDEMRSKRLTCLSIAEMVNLRISGAPIEFTEVRDSVTVYDIIVEHLRDWASIVSAGVYDKLPPAEEFFILDEMASELHPYVALGKMKELNSGIDTRNLGQTFFGKNNPDKLYTLDKASSYKNIAPVIINKARAYYGADEFGLEG